VLSRLAGRAVTGPIAFALATVTDLLIFTLRSLGARVKQLGDRRAA
jgi:hypothetical protein